MSVENLLLVIIALGVAALPIIIAATRRHAYTGAILVVVLISIVVGCITGGIGGLIGWGVAFGWAVWPRKSGFVFPLIDATSVNVGETLGRHKRDHVEAADPEDIHQD